MKIRVIETPIYTDFMNAMGANATPLPYPELYTALEQRAIDGGTQPITNVVNAKLYEVQKYLTITNHMYSPQSILIGKKAWDSLSPAEQKLVQEAADEARDYQRKISLERNAQGLDELKKLMTVNALPPAELAKMADKAKPVVAKYTVIVGEPLVKELYAEVAKMRAQK
jgi:TRAP-type C4-dicarboxylate transport system substrate-binding protein